MGPFTCCGLMACQPRINNLVAKCGGVALEYMPMLAQSVTGDRRSAGHEPARHSWLDDAIRVSS